MARTRVAQGSAGTGHVRAGEAQQSQPETRRSGKAIPVVRNAAEPMKPAPGRQILNRYGRGGCPLTVRARVSPGPANQQHRARAIPGRPADTSLTTNSPACAVVTPHALLGRRIALRPRSVRLPRYPAVRSAPCGQGPSATGGATRGAVGSDRAERRWGRTHEGRGHSVFLGSAASDVAEGLAVIERGLLRQYLPPVPVFQ